MVTPLKNYYKKELIIELGMSEKEAEELINKFYKSILNYKSETNLLTVDTERELRLRLKYYIETNKIDSYIIFKSKKELKDKVPKQCRQYFERIFKLRRCHDTFYYKLDKPYFEQINIGADENVGYGSAKRLVDELNSMVYLSKETHYPIDDGMVDFNNTNFKTQYKKLTGKKPVDEAIKLIESNIYCHSVKKGKNKKEKPVLKVEWKQAYGLFDYKYLFDNILTNDIPEAVKDSNILMFRNGYYLFKEREFHKYKKQDEIFGIDYTRFNYLNEEQLKKGNELIDSKLQETHAVYCPDGSIDEELTQEEITKHLTHHAYLLTPGNPLKRFFEWVGVPNAGKSLWVNVLKKTIGIPNVSEKSLAEITEGGFQRQTLIGKILNVSSDATKGVTNFGVIKQITGNDSLNVQVKHGEDVIILPNEMPCLLEISNKIPFMEFDKAMVFRTTLLEFKNGVSKEDMDPDLEDKLSTIENLEYLLSLSLHNYKKELLMEEVTQNTIFLHMIPEQVIMQELFIPTDNNNDEILIQEFHNLIRQRATELGIVDNLEFTKTGKLQKVKNHFTNAFDRALHSGELGTGRTYTYLKINPDFEYLKDIDVEAEQ